jgi:S1-C subfamily serine protease
MTPLATLRASVLCISAPLAFLLAPAFVAAPAARADKLEITSNPSGATVEIDGVAVGATPFAKDFPGGYFHRTRTALGSRLEHPLVARISLAGYATKELQLSEGPMNWVGLNGRNHGEYWLLKSSHFHVDLELVSAVFTGSVSARTSSEVSGETGAELSLEELVARTKPAVVYLKGLEKAGSGFFVSETGVIATNAHVARGEESLLTLLPGGQQLEAKVVYIDADLDIALAKVEGSGFPHLTLADASTVRQGENVLAIGNPGDAMLFSVTKGIVSAVGKLPSAGPGTWIQTDTPINPGNSGGPLLNARGEVVGINTQKLVKKNVNGIGFALSAGDLLAVLRRFYPEDGSATEKLSVPSKTRELSSASLSQIDVGVVVISDPKGAGILVDKQLVGFVPAELTLPAGPHTIIIRRAGQVDVMHTISVLKNSRVSLAPSN